MDLVSRGFDGACAHPAPDKDDVLIRRIVEAVPAAARRIDDVAFDRRFVSMVGIDHPVTFEHDKKFVAVVMAVIFVSSAGLEHSPANDMVRSSRFLVD